MTCDCEGAGVSRVLRMIGVVGVVAGAGIVAGIFVSPSKSSAFMVGHWLSLIPFNQTMWVLAYQSSIFACKASRDWIKWWLPQDIPLDLQCGR